MAAPEDGDSIAQQRSVSTQAMSICCSCANASKLGAAVYAGCALPPAFLLMLLLLLLAPAVENTPAVSRLVDHQKRQ
jgi:hypothetical protein